MSISKYNIGKIREAILSQPVPLTRYGGRPLLPGSVNSPELRTGRANPVAARALIAEVPERLVFEAVEKRDKRGLAARYAVRELLLGVPDLLQKYRVTDADFKQPGRLMPAVRQRFERMVRDDPNWWDRARAASFKVDCPRPADRTETDDGLAGPAA